MKKYDIHCICSNFSRRLASKFFHVFFVCIFYKSCIFPPQPGSPRLHRASHQTLAVYHYGYYTLKDRTVQFHEPKHVPSDAEAVLEWGLNTPFNSQDKPPLAVAMVVTVNGARSLKRFRLVIAQKSKLRLTQEVTAALASHSRDHRFTASSFFPCSNR